MVGLSKNLKTDGTLKLNRFRRLFYKFTLKASHCQHTHTAILLADLYTTVGGNIPIATDSIYCYVQEEATPG